jgi:hypothetical protein
LAGDNFYIGARSFIEAAGGLKVGDDTMIAPDVKT